MEMNTNLRQADAFVTVEGILSEKKLEMTKSTEGINVIRGSLVLKTGDTNFTTLNVYVNELTSKNEPNKAYEGMKTVMEEYKSIAEVGEAEATKVVCRRGNLQPNTYIQRETYDEISNVRYSASFVSRVLNEVEYSPRAEFEVEGYIASIVNEVKQGEETGRLKLTLIVPTYRGAEPMELIVPEDLADDVDSAYEVGQTARFYGELKNNVIVENNVIKMAIGKDRVESKTTYVNEIVITGASEAYEEEREYASEVIAQAMTERSLRLDREKTEAKENKKSSAVSTPKPVAGRPLPKFSM